LALFQRHVHARAIEIAERIARSELDVLVRIFQSGIHISGGIERARTHHIQLGSRRFEIDGLVQQGNGFFELTRRHRLMRLGDEIIDCLVVGEARRACKRESQKHRQQHGAEHAAIDMKRRHD